MTDIAFYHLRHWPLERALPKLLEKTLAAGKRAVVKVGSDQRLNALNSALWTYDQDSWLPHGTLREGFMEDQPVWLTTGDDAPEGTQFLFLADGAVSDRMGDFERCFDVFDGNDEAALKAARERWKAYRDDGHAVAYWHQTDGGGWEEKG